MKKNKTKIYTLVLLILIMPLSGCDSWLELTPPDGLVKDEFWQTKEDLEAMLMGAYQSFASLDEMLFYFGELRGDMVEEDNNTEWRFRQVMEGNIYPNNSMSNWQVFYQVISYCNLVLKYADPIHELDQTFTAFQKSSFEAEAIYLRSLAYFYLVRIFKDVPLVLEASESDDAEFYLEKTTDVLILAQIKQDLLDALPAATEDYGSLEENKGRVTRSAFYALLADISLWNFEYEDVINYATEIENAGFLLLPAGKWYENFYPGNSLSSIFEFQFNASLEQYNDIYWHTYFQNRRIKASSKAVELLSLDSESGEIYRARGSIREADASIWKYCGQSPDGRSFRSSTELYDANWIVYRYADVLLMKAEALSQLGSFSEAQDILDQIRIRALAKPITVAESEQAFEDAILRERAIELAFEGKRWFDLLRMGRRNDFQRKGELIEIIIENVPSTQRLVLASKLTDPNGWYMPIQEDEIERNSNLVQNPYYAIYMNDD